LHCQEIQTGKLNDFIPYESRKTVTYETYLKELLEHLHNIIFMIPMTKSINAESSNNETNNYNMAKSKYHEPYSNIPNTLTPLNRSIYIKYYPP